MQTIEDWGDAVLVSVTEALRNFLGFIPQLIGALIVLILGWIIAGLLARLVQRVLEAVGFERAAESTGITGFIRQSGSDWTASRILAEIVKWFIRLIAIQAAATILGMAQISQIINSILLWLPNLVVAIAIIVIGALIARFVGGLVRGATGEMGFGNPSLMGAIARYAILVFAVIAAVDQLGIAETVVNTLFVGAVAAIAAALALAFGLGGQDVARQMTQGWYQRGQDASRKVAEYAQRRQVDAERVRAAGQPLPGSASVEPAREAPGQPPGQRSTSPAGQP
ncbi:MAG TPA: small-conductance mechanosensitive ion channel [Candidatus Limnocylindria bacterium]|nr:small-conductance mechanosensitive ion channel [Candidatus Limnocylindria bacterium]